MKHGMKHGTNNTYFKKTPIAAGLSLALASYGLSAQTSQESEPDALPMEEVVVRGIRQSLKRSMDIKRSSAGVVDAITAEDIGSFPDSNLAEAMQRITGVSIDRERGEGKSVTVRGFGPAFNLVLLNGRQMPTTGGESRSFDFANLASEGIAAVEVYKTGKADVPTGGIGSTINIKTTRPLEAPGRRTSFALSAMNDSSTEKGDDWTPEISALFSDTFVDDTVGVALSLVRQERNNGAATASVGGWRSFAGNVDNDWSGDPARPSEWGGIPSNGDTQVNRTRSPDERYSVPQNTGYEFAEWDQLRTNGQLTLQWRPADNLTGTLDYTYSELELERTFSNYSAWYNFGGQESSWDGNANASPLFYAENNGGSGDFAMAGGADAEVSENKSLGLNLVWDVSDSLSLMLDYHDSQAEKQPASRFGSASQLAIASFSRDKTTTYFDRGQLPVLSLDLSQPLSADDMIVTGSVFSNEYAKMDIEQLRLAGDFQFDPNDFVTGIDFGIELTEVNNRSASSMVQRDAWGGVSEAGAIADLLTPASAAGRFDEVSGGKGDPSDFTTDYFTYSMPQLIERTEQLIASGDAQLTVLADMGDCGTGLCASSDYSTDRRTTEEQIAVYAQAHLEFELGDSMPLDIRVGIRYEETDVDSEALAPNYSRIDWVGGNEFSAVRGTGDFTQLKGSYDSILPSLDIKLGITDDMIGRLSYSSTITRPNYADIQGGQTIAQLVRIDGGTGSRGNPGLDPFESDNIDISFEYYYGADSYVSIGYFYKDVENFIGIEGIVETLFNLPHPGNGALADEARAVLGQSATSGELYAWILANRADAPNVNTDTNIITGVAGDELAYFSVNAPVNQGKDTVDGWELNVQHNIGDTGFGFIANATFVDSDSSFDSLDLTQQFAISGVSDSANLIFFYDKEGISVKLAYNWRDDFLAGIGQDNVGAAPPTYVKAYDQIDIALGYQINDQAQIFLDGINVTNETTYVYGRTESQPLFVGQAGARYDLGFRYKF